MATTVELTCPTCNGKLEAVNKYYMQCHNCRSVFKRDFNENGVQLDFVDNNLDQMMTQVNQTMTGSNMLASEVAIQRLREDVGTLQQALTGQVAAAQAQQRDIDALNRQMMTLRERLHELDNPTVAIPTRPDHLGVTLWLTWAFFIVVLALRANNILDGSPKSGLMRLLIEAEIAPPPGTAHQMVMALDVLSLIMLVLVPIVILLYSTYRALQFRALVREATSQLLNGRSRLENQIEQLHWALRQRRDELDARHEQIARLETDLRQKSDELRWHEGRVAR